MPKRRRPCPNGGDHDDGKKTVVHEIAFQVAARSGTAGPARPWRFGPDVPANDCGSDAARAPLPVAVLAERALSFTPRRILVGIDFSPISEGARRLALGIGLAAGAVVDLVNVLDGFEEIFVRKNLRLLDGGPEGDDGAIALGADIEDALVCRQRLALAAGIRCVHSTLFGMPGLVLGEHAARTGADLIVLGVGAEQPSRFGWTWGARAADQLRRAGKWHGPILLRRDP